MADDSSDNALIRTSNKSITRYSNTLVRRALAQIAPQSPELIRSAQTLRDVLINNSYEDKEQRFGQLLRMILQYKDLEVTLVESYRHFEDASVELYRNEYRVVILQGRLTFDLIPTIKEKYPRTRILGMSAIPLLDDSWVSQGLDSFVLKGRLDKDDLVAKVKELLAV